MFERLERSAGATALAIGIVLGVAIVLNVVFTLPTELHGLIVIAALGAAMLLAAAHTTSGGTPARTRHGR